MWLTFADDENLHLKCNKRTLFRILTKQNLSNRHLKVVYFFNVFLTSYSGTKKKTKNQWKCGLTAESVCRVSGCRQSDLRQRRKESNQHSAHGLMIYMISCEMIFLQAAVNHLRAPPPSSQPFTSITESYVRRSTHTGWLFMSSRIKTAVLDDTLLLRFKHLLEDWWWM